MHRAMGCQQACKLQAASIIQIAHRVLLLWHCLFINIPCCKFCSSGLAWIATRINNRKTINPFTSIPHDGTSFWHEDFFTCKYFFPVDGSNILADLWAVPGPMCSMWLVFVCMSHHLVFACDHLPITKAHIDKFFFGCLLKRVEAHVACL